MVPPGMGSGNPACDGETATSAPTLGLWRDRAGAPCGAAATLPTRPPSPPVTSPGTPLPTSQAVSFAVTDPTCPHRWAPPRWANQGPCAVATVPGSGRATSSEGDLGLRSRLCHGRAVRSQTDTNSSAREFPHLYDGGDHGPHLVGGGGTDGLTEGAQHRARAPHALAPGVSRPPRAL